MTNYLDRPAYDDIAEEARADWAAERPAEDLPTPDELGCGRAGSCGAWNCYCERLLRRARR